MNTLDTTSLAVSAWLYCGALFWVVLVALFLILLTGGKRDPWE